MIVEPWVVVVFAMAFILILFVMVTLNGKAQYWEGKFEELQKSIADDADTDGWRDEALWWRGQAEKVFASKCTIDLSGLDECCNKGSIMGS